MPKRKAQFDHHANFWIPMELWLKINAYARLVFFGNASELMRHVLQQGINHMVDALNPADKERYDNYYRLLDMTETVEKSLEE